MWRKELKMLLLKQLVVIIVIFQLFEVTEATNDGLYVTNGTHILYLDQANTLTGQTINLQTVHKQEHGRIVGLAVDIEDNLLFWSDNSHNSAGIHVGTLNDGGQLLNVSKIIENDLVEVSSLAVDWEAKNVYWVDARRRTLEVATYSGQHRRVLGVSGLHTPRGVYCDPGAGYLFWTDQGGKVIGRSRPDGSSQEVIIDTDVQMPNHMVIHGSQLYWVDSGDRTVWRSALDGSRRERLGSVAGGLLPSDVFGLMLDQDGQIFVSVPQRGVVLSFSVHDGHLASGREVTPYRLGTAVYGMVYYGRENIQMPASNPCAPARLRYGCSHLCLPTGATSGRCACPSSGGLSLGKDRKTCGVPTSVLLFVSAGAGTVEYIDTAAVAPGNQPDRYLVGRSLRPVAVTYDPVSKTVYWSDVYEQRVHSASLDGSQHTVVLDQSRGVGVVDGMAFDVRNRKLYYSNMGSSFDGQTQYSWHKIEVFDLEKNSIRTVVTDVEKPRALWVDSEEGFLYYTDWGTNARVVRTQLDGSDPETLYSGLDNPNGLAVHDGEVVVVDSHYKTRQQENSRYPTPESNGTMSLLNLDGSGLQKWDLTGIQTPFAVSSNPKNQQYFITDWDTQSILTLTLTSSGVASSTPLVTGIKSPMGVLYTDVSVTTVGNSPCDSKLVGCEGICFSSVGQTEAVCSCSSYKAHVLQNDLQTCKLPEEFALFADMTGIKMVGFDTKDQSVYTIAGGNNNVSNIVALEYDHESKMLYYSEASEHIGRGIYKMTLDGSTPPMLVYRGNAVIEGLALKSNGFLYWTDMLAGHIAYILTDRSDTDGQRVLVDGLKSPRAIRVDSEHKYLYWTECGDSPRVARLDLFGASPGPQTLLSGNTVRQPNALDLHVPGERMYVGDGFFNTVTECHLDGTSCSQLVSSQLGGPDQLFSISVQGGQLLYSDWSRGSVGAVTVSSGYMETVAAHLVRPTSVVMQYYTGKECPSDHGCSGRCVVTPSSHHCECEQGETLITDTRTCIQAPAPGVCPGSVAVSVCASLRVCDADAGCPGAQLCCPACGGNKRCLAAAFPDRCVYNNATHDVGTSFSPQPCTECQCTVQNGLANVECGLRTCPALPCATRRILPAGECCHVCESSDVRPVNIIIQNCPQDAVISLTADRDHGKARHDFYIQPYDLTGLRRTITITKEPSGAYYAWTGGSTRVTWTAVARRLNGGQDRATCTYSITVTDPHPPDLWCPADVVVYTSQNSARVEWLPPTVTDNVAVAPGSPRRTRGPPWGGRLSRGRHDVTYTATDSAGNNSSCSFSVTVNRLVSAACEVHPPLSGEFRCADAGTGVVACVLLCDAVRGYVLNPRYAGRYQFSCERGEWSPALPWHYRLDACVLVEKRSFRQSVSLLMSGCPQGVSWPSMTSDLQHRACTRYPRLCQAGAHLMVTVDTALCEEQGGDRYVTVKIDLHQKYSPGTQDGVWQELLSADFRRMTSSIGYYADLPLIRPVSMTTHVYDVAKATVVSRADVNTNITSQYRLWGCDPGQTSVTKGCLVCPAGMYKTSSVLGDCVICEANTFSAAPQQTSCQACTEGLCTAGLGAYTHNMCQSCERTNPGTNTNKTVNQLPATEKTAGVNVLVLGIVVAVATLIMIVIVIVVIIFVRRHRKKPAMTTDDGFTNPMFGDTRSEVSMSQSVNNNDKKGPDKKGQGKGRSPDTGSVRSMGSTSSAMARRYPYMPEKEVEISIDEKGKVEC